MTIGKNRFFIFGVTLPKFLTLLVFCLVSSFVVILPNILFRWQLGSLYQGVQFSISDNEALYAARVRAVYQGDLLVRSPMIFEIRNNPYLQPPFAEYIFGSIGKFAKLSVAQLFLLLKIILPPLMLLAYWWVMRKISGSFWLGLVIAIMATLGQELVAFPIYLMGKILQGSLIIQSSIYFTRVVHPLGSGLLYILAIYCLYQFVTFPRKYSWIGAGFSLGVLVYTYFYYWTQLATVYLLLGIYYLATGNRRQTIRLLGVFLVFSAIAIPYLQNLASLSALPYFDAVRRQMGLVPNAKPVIPLFQIGLSLFYIWYVAPFRRSTPDIKVLGLAALLSYIVVVNQQVVSRLSFHGGHWQWLANPPLLLLATAISLRLRPVSLRLKRIFGASIILGVILVSVFLQFKAFQSQLPKYTQAQRWAPAFSWLSSHATNEAVVLSDWEIADFLPYYTNVYAYTSQNEINAPIPPERLQHNAFVRWRLRGWCQQPDLLSKNLDELSFGLFGYSYYHLPLTPQLLGLPRVLEQFSDFCDDNFTEQLRKYKIDYIMIERGEAEARISALGQPVVFADPSILIYAMR